jgi:hypothetical protein
VSIRGSGEVRWIRSSYCAQGTCIVAGWSPGAYPQDGILIRDSKIEDGPVLQFSAAAFRNFVAAVKAGEFQA